MQTIATLVAQFAKAGKVEWIGVRPARKEPLISLSSAKINVTGIEGDHRTKPGKRTVTLIQAEHLSVIASLCADETSPIDPARLRRNIVVSGISLMGLRNREFRIGNVLLRGSGLCAPCSRMETELGHGGYNAMRGHGGICAEVLEDGLIAINEPVISYDNSEN
ncbi:MAG: MOSC domain-containing protein [Hyphomicrobiales bacterium]